MRGGIAAPNSPGSSSDIGYSTLGTRIAGLMILPNGMALTPWGSLGWQHAIGAVTPSVALAFATTGAGFAVQGVPLAREGALKGAGPLGDEGFDGDGAWGELAEGGELGRQGEGKGVVREIGAHAEWTWRGCERIRGHTLGGSNDRCREQGEAEKGSRYTHQTLREG